MNVDVPIAIKKIDWRKQQTFKELFTVYGSVGRYNLFTITMNPDKTSTIKFTLRSTLPDTRPTPCASLEGAQKLATEMLESFLKCLIV